MPFKNWEEIVRPEGKIWEKITNGGVAVALSTRRPWLFNDDSKQTITSVERLNQLTELDLDFEACVVQATVVEALLLLLISSRSMRFPKSESDKIRTKLVDQTFGSLINRAKKHGLLTTEFIKEIQAYCLKRNMLVHHYLVEKYDFDSRAFFEDGEALLDQLNEWQRDTARELLTSQGIPDANLWE